MSNLELLWIPAVLGWIPLIYADEISELLRPASGVVEESLEAGRPENPPTS